MSQSSRVMAALTCCWTTTTWSWVVSVPRVGRGDGAAGARRRSGAAVAVASGSVRSVMVRVIQRSSRAICSSRSWQGADGDEDAAQVLDRSCRRAVHRGLGGSAGWPAARSRRIGGAALRSSQAATVAGPLGGREGLVEGLQFAGGSGRCRRRAVRAAAGGRCSGRSLAARCGCGRVVRSSGSCARSRGRGGCRWRTAARRGCRRGPAAPHRSRRSGPSAVCRLGTTACRWSWRSRTAAVRPQMRRSGSSMAGSAGTAARRGCGR